MSAYTVGGWVWREVRPGVWESTAGDAGTARAVGLFRSVRVSMGAAPVVPVPVDAARAAKVAARRAASGVVVVGGADCTVAPWVRAVVCALDGRRADTFAAQRVAVMEARRASGGSVGLPVARVVVPFSPSGSIVRLAELDRASAPRRLRAFPGARRKAGVGLSERVRGEWDGFASLGSVAGVWGVLAVWSRGEGMVPAVRWDALTVGEHRADCLAVWGVSRDAWGAATLGRLAQRWARSVRAPGVSDTSREDAIAAARCAALGVADGPDDWVAPPSAAVWFVPPGLAMGCPVARRFCARTVVAHGLGACVRLGCPAWGDACRVRAVAAARHSLRGDALGGGRMRDESARMGGGLLLSADQAEGLAMAWLSDASAGEERSAWVPDWDGGPRAACAAVLRRLLAMGRVAARSAHPPRRRAVRGTYRRVASVVRGMMVDGLPVAEAVERAGWAWDWSADVREVSTAVFSGDGASRGRSRSWERAGLPLLRAVAGLSASPSARDARRGEAWREFLGLALARVAARIPAEVAVSEPVAVGVLRGGVAVDRAAILRAVGR